MRIPQTRRFEVMLFPASYCWETPEPRNPVPQRRPQVVEPLGDAALEEQIYVEFKDISEPGEKT